MRINRIYFHVVLCLIGLSLFTSGCAIIKGRTAADPHQLLQKNVETLWMAKVNKDWGTVYDLTTEKFKKSTNRDNYIRGCGLVVTQFSIKDIEILEDGNSAKATVSFDTSAMGIPFKDMVVTENWILENKTWRLDLPTDFNNPFSMKTK